MLKPKQTKIKKSLINKGIEKVQIIRNERAINNHFLNAEKEYLNAEKEYKEAKKLSPHYENKYREFKDNEPTLEHCETLRALIIKEEKEIRATEKEIRATEKEIRATEKEIKATKEEIRKLLKT
jgi:capsule polysaccharide export protein KpsE/RkpR